MLDVMIFSGLAPGNAETPKVRRFKDVIFFCDSVWSKLSFLGVCYFLKII